MSSTSQATVNQGPSGVPGASLKSSKAPILGEGFQENSKNYAPKSFQSSGTESDEDEKKKTSKRRLFGFGKKKDIKVKDKEREKKAKQAESSISGGSEILQTTTVQPVHQRATQPISPPRPNHPYRNPSSPIHRAVYPSSPRVVSPAGSQIFERNVQESALPVAASSAIPSHITTENYIPPVLDASSEAITNKSLDPDSVEIVTHASHQPASAVVNGLGSSEVLSNEGAEDYMALSEMTDSATSYGALDSTDIRRLSFISFADVVQSENAEHGARDSMHITGLSSLSSSGLIQSPSPIRSPISLHGRGTSPPPSKEASIKGLDLSPVRKSVGLGNPAPLPSPSSGELTIETMTQALRRTGSGDFSGVRSLPLSPISQDGVTETPFQ